MPLLNRIINGPRAAGTGKVPAFGQAASLPGQLPSEHGAISSPSRHEETGGGLSPHTCGANACTGGWLRPWKNRQRPVFEGQWSCSPRCLEQLVRVAVRRETVETSLPPAGEAHQHRIPLGLVLLAQGWITHPQLQSALAAQRAAGTGRVGDWLTRGCGLPEDRIARGLGVQWNRPVLNLDGFSPRQMGLVMPKRFISEFGMLPLRIAGSRLMYVAFQESLNSVVALSLEQMCGFRVESGLLTSTQYASARQRLLAAESVPVRVKLFEEMDGLSAAVVQVMERSRAVGARLVRVQQYFWLRLWLKEPEPALGRAGTQTLDDAEDHIFMRG